ncbi:hypothetical protein [Nocardioides humi]|uniref:Lipoprotein n=1 Tax=Nocardioides humi TaxID=449461 RepID=A0ABN1ZX40_9ACTN|nr:hypothetical protein [Nocardioides humi]
MRRLVAAAAAMAALVVGGCSVSDDGATDAEAGAIAAAQAYVDAIAARDLATVEEMTDPEAFRYHVASAKEQDIRAALPDAEPIADPWVSLVSATSEARYGPVEYLLDVSYELRGLTGGGTVVVRLGEDADPDDVASWTVTEPLVVRASTWVDGSHVPAARIGRVALPPDSSSSALVKVWGYPGGYTLEPAEPIPEVEPLWVAVGLADAPPWDDSLPKLGERPDD